MRRANNQPPASWEDAAIRAAYEQYGVEGFYQRFGDSYRNPHERVIGATKSRYRLHQYIENLLKVER